MPPQAYALVTLFLACSILARDRWPCASSRARAVRAGSPRTCCPIVGGFGAFYLIGHRLGLVVGPEISLFGFQVALLGDLAIGFAAALVVAAPPGRVVRARSRPGRQAGRPVLGRGHHPGSSPVATGIPAVAQSLYDPG